MLKRRIYLPLSILCLTFFIGAFSVQAQPDTLYEDSLCEFTWNSDVNDCPDTIDCIYIDDTLNQYQFSVPYNITHIAKEGLEICLEDLELSRPVDIIYIIDYSRSMISTFIPPGDEFHKRDDALEAGFSYQYNEFPQSKAGYVGFGSNLALQSTYPSLSGDHLLAPVNVETEWALLDNIITIARSDVDNDRHASGTNYYAALDQAIKWIQDPSICPHEDKSIIFISDGDPNEGGDYGPLTNILISENVPVHGIFLGSGMGEGLDTLATVTGGTSWLVPPEDTDTLSTVVTNIVQTYNVEFVSKGITIINQTTNSSATGQITEYDDTTWVVNLYKPVGLKQGLNRLNLNARFGQQGTDTLDTLLFFDFFIDVSPFEPYTSECYECWYRTQIKVVEVNSPLDEIDTLTWQYNEYRIQLEYYGSDTTVDTVDIIVRTTQKGDLDTITITNPSFDGEKYIFDITVPFAVTTGNAIHGNGETEADYQDMVTLYWQHPEESMDTAYAEVPVSAPPDRMEIHDKAGTPSAASKYATSPNTDTLTAGILADLYAKVFADIKWLEEYETDPNLYKDISWAFIDIATGNPDPTIGTLGTASGVAHNTFFPIKAYHTIDLTATLTVVGLNPITEIIRLYIKPGEPKQLVIEATNDINLTPDLNNPVPWDPITMPGNINQLSTYAILRDSLGNWVGPATSESWDEQDANVVTVANGAGAGEGVISKGGAPSGQTKIWAWQGTMSDTSTVITLEYNIIDLEIVRIHGLDTSTIDQLTMNQNQDTTLYAYGQRSDNNNWILVDASWGIDPKLTQENPPTASKSWSFSPESIGSGIIWASFVGLSDTVNFTFTVGPPLFVEFEIITPDSLLIAGQPILGEVLIRNQDGPVPGLWTYPGSGLNPAYYTDILGGGKPGTLGYIPFGTTDTNSVFLDSSLFNDSVSVTQYFYNGVDTLTFILYNTGSTKDFPDPDPHQLTVYLDALSDATDQFILLPGPLDSIELVPDTLPVLTPNDPSFVIVGYGFDQYGNYLPKEIFSWSNDSTLFDFYINVNGIQVYIDPSDATDDQEGWINVQGISEPNVFNKIYLKIIGPRPRLTAAITDDRNGNGFLDLIKLSFDRPFSLPPGYNPGNILVHEDPAGIDIQFTVDSITVAPFSDNKKFFLHLDEDKFWGDTVPHSSWTPELTINDMDSIQPIIRVTCSDGAPPVVWKAVNKIEDIYDHTKDRVTITLSENFFNVDGSAFLNVAHKPPEVFNVWIRPQTNYIKVDSILARISQFNEQKDEWTNFKMTNNKILHAHHFVNINHLIAPLADKEGNTPYITNQKVRVKVLGGLGNIVVAPVPINPSIHFFNQQINIPLTPIDPHIIHNMILTQGGVMIQIDLMGIEEAEAKLMVFDAVGNLAFSKASDDNFIDDLPDWQQQNLISGDGPVTLSFYWSGCTSRGMKAAPGVYRLIVYVIPKKPPSRTKKFAKTVAVKRQ